MPVSGHYEDDSVNQKMNEMFADRLNKGTVHEDKIRMQSPGSDVNFRKVRNAIEQSLHDDLVPFTVNTTHDSMICFIEEKQDGKQ